MGRQKLIKLLMAVGLTAVLLTTAGVAFGSSDYSNYDNLGRLDLVLNDAQGDKFVFTPAGGSSTTTQTLAVAGCRINPASGSLVALSANGANEPGLKDHVIGVRSKSGEGNGTPCARINNSFDTNASNAEKLTITLAGTLSTYQADYVQLGLKLKFGATARVEAFSGNSSVWVQDIPCAGTNDCGADSGNDRVLAKIDPPGNARFNRIVISVLSPSDGSVSLLDDPGFDTFFNLAGDMTKPTIALNGADPLVLTVGDPFVDPGAAVNDNLDPPAFITGVSNVPVNGQGITTTSGTYSITYDASDLSGNAAVQVVRTVIVYDGTLDCQELTGTVGGPTTMQGTFKRLANRDGSACELKPYNLSVSSTGDTLTFDPDDASQLAAYSGIISAPPKTPANPTTAKLEYDPELDGTFVNMKWCLSATIDADGWVTTADLPPIAGFSPDDDPWCIAAENTAIASGSNIRTTWTVYGWDDPIFRGN